MPLTQCELPQIVSLEAFAISRDQPSADKMGKGIETRAVWELSMANVGRQPRPPRWQLSVTSPVQACGLNFWENIGLVSKALHGEWRPSHSPKCEGSVGSDARTPKPPPDTSALSSKAAYHDKQTETKIRGPINIYDVGERGLLCNHVATSSTVIRSVQSERIDTSGMFDMYLRSDKTRSDAKRKLYAKNWGRC